MLDRGITLLLFDTAKIKANSRLRLLSRQNLGPPGHS